jgi:hypothetical protein
MSWVIPRTGERLAVANGPLFALEKNIRNELKKLIGNDKKNEMIYFITDISCPARYAPG